MADNEKKGPEAGTPGAAAARRVSIGHPRAAGQAPRGTPRTTRPSAPVTDRPLAPGTIFATFLGKRPSGSQQTPHPSCWTQRHWVIPPSRGGGARRSDARQREDHLRPTRPRRGPGWLWQVLPTGPRSTSPASRMRGESRPTNTTLNIGIRHPAAAVVIVCVICTSSRAYPAPNWAGWRAELETDMNRLRQLHHLQPLQSWHQQG